MMVLINFALEKLGSQIKTDKVSVDGYEAYNLLRGASGWQKKGFLAERFIKPPVTLTLTLPCPVNLCRIVLDPQVGGQRSSSVDIYTAVAHRTIKMTRISSVHAHGSESKGSSSDRNTACVSESSMLDKHETVPEPIFVRVAGSYRADPGKLCFTNPRFNTDQTFHSPETFAHVGEMRHHQWWAVSAVDFVAVRITSAVGGGVVAVGSLEVWGVPARTCPPHIKENIALRYFSLSQSYTKMCVSESTKYTSEMSNSDRQGMKDYGDSHKSKTSCTLDEKLGPPDKTNKVAQQMDPLLTDTVEQVHVPEEFLDPLTWEVIVTPMLLPSGHTVDLSTLDRFSEVEATHGRQASDPFTGLVFTPTRCPVLNKGLKVRIDRFLSENANDLSLRQVPRVLGHGESLGHGMPLPVEHTVNPLAHAATSIASSTNGCMLKELKRKHVLSHSGHSDTFPNKFTKKDNPDGRDQLHGVHGTYSTSNISATAVAEESVHSTSAFYVKNTKTLVRAATGTASSNSGCMYKGVKCVSSREMGGSHEDRLKDSLSNSLFSVLKSLPSFTAPSPPPSLAERGQQCSACCYKLEQHDRMFYKLLCGHIICRVCLTAAEKAVSFACPFCGTDVKRAEISRIHK